MTEDGRTDPGQFRRTGAALFLAVLFTVAICGCSGRRPVEIAAIRVGQSVFSVEVARMPEEWAVGLSGRDCLAGNGGMLFVTPVEEQFFWMKDTRFPLDIAFLDDDGVVVNVATMPPHTLEYAVSLRPVGFVLELPAGSFEKAGIGEGDRVLSEIF